MKLSSIKTNQYKNNDKILGKYKENDIILKKGPYGYYLNNGDKNINLKNHLIKNKCKPESINLKDIIYLLEYPMEIGKYKNSKIMILIGPYGKYMKYKNKNYKIQQKDKYTLEECIRILDN